MDLQANFRISAGVEGQREIDKLNASLLQTGKAAQVSAGQTAAAMRTLPAQMTDVATSLAGGQSPFLVLLQQGGQIKDQFGSIGAAARGVGQYVAALANPFTLAAGAVALLGGAALMGANQQAALRDSLVLTGNAAGITYTEA